jgi:hypothetical protein
LPRLCCSGLLVTFLYFRSVAKKQQQEEEEGKGCNLRESAVKFVTLLFYRFVR